MPCLVIHVLVLKKESFTTKHVPVHAHKQHSGHECSEYLREYIVGHFPPRKALPDGEANCDGWVEVATRCRAAGNDSKRDAHSEAPADLEDTAESRGIGLGGINVEGSDGCYAREA